MQFFQNMTIRGKIVVVLLLVIALQLTSAVFSTYYLSAVNERIERIVDRESEKIRLAGRIHCEILDLSRIEAGRMGHAPGFFKHLRTDPGENLPEARRMNRFSRDTLRGDRKE